MCIANKKVLPSQILQMLTVCNLNSPACKSQSLFKKVVDSKCSDKVCIRYFINTISMKRRRCPRIELLNLVVRPIPPLLRMTNFSKYD